MWVKFSESKPEEKKYEKGNYLITRFPGDPGDCFETWRIWKHTYLKIGTKHITHWWNGVSDMDIAIKNWFKQEPSEDC